MSFTEIDGRKFKESIKVLRTVIGRSDEYLRRIHLKDGTLIGSDGCLRVFVKIDENLKGWVSVPSDVMWALAKHSSTAVKINLRKDYMVFESEKMNLLIKSTKDKLPVKVKCKEFLGDFKRVLIRALDYVSRPLDEDDFVEVHSVGGELFFLGKTGGLTGAFTGFKIEKELSFAGRLIYQSVRHLVKAFSGVKDLKVSFSPSDLCFNAGEYEAFLCMEPLDKVVKKPEASADFIKVDRKRLTSLLEAACDVLGRAYVDIMLKSGEISVRGKRKGIEFFMNEKAVIEGDYEISAVVPAKKFKSYISNMGGNFVFVSQGKETVKFWDRSGRRYVIARRAL